MKKSSSKNKVERKIAKVPRIRRIDVLSAFKRLGFDEDINHPQVTVLREADFPFRRITLPNKPKISLELVKVHLKEIGIDLQLFIKYINS